MKIYDISVPVSPHLPIFPGDPPVRIDRVTTLAKGGPSNVSSISMSTHTGSHIDAPLHFNDHGVSVDHLPLTLLVGPVLVADVRGIPAIDGETLGRLPLSGVERLLLRTDNSILWDREGFQKDYVHVTQDGAEYLVKKKIRLIGIDYLSVERFDGDGAVHRLLLGNGTVILEGLNLDGVEEGDYELICLPLKIKGGDGAPVRAILRSRGEMTQAADFDPHSSRWPLA